MIIQRLLDWVAYALASGISSLGFKESDWAGIIGGINGGLSWLSSSLGKLSPLVPWNDVGSMLNIWVVLMGVGLAVQGLRLALWVVGR